MTLSTKDCQQAICDWVKKNMHLMPIEPYAQSLMNGGNHPWVTDGTTKLKSWKRRCKATVGDTVLRAFSGECLIFPSDTIMLVHEQNGQIVKIECGTREIFEPQYNIRIKYSFE